MMAQVQQQYVEGTRTSGSRRMTAFGGKTADHGVNFSNTAHLSKGVVSLRKGSPFSHTPAKRMILPTLYLQENADPQIGLLLCKQWTLYSVTPLYNFSYGQLNEYSRQLSLFIAAEKQKRLAVEVESDLAFKVKFSSFSALKTTEQEPAAVLIQIMQRSQAAAKNEEGKVVWTGWFSCTGGNDIFVTVMEDFTCLPLFLVSGAKGLMLLVETWLQQTFDCCLSPLHITPINLAWMAAIWTGCYMENHMAATELTFSVPGPAYPLDISYAIHPEDAKALWDSIHSTPGEVGQEEVELFMDCLYNHFHRHFKIYLSAARLVKVSTSVASVHSVGKIKILHAQHLIGILSLLTELAVSKTM
ncbi:centromere protein L isoform X2 [Rhineura floridana]|uniref:centromere protein L isoform X2 n=1 Tax=Rhineura floridana TaxID=261503 RepID=UPI002AC8260E|nr:centromere protein L isoform X2 [Rhineura floridana]